MSGTPVEVQIKATGVDGVQRQLRLVKDEIKGVGAETASMSHNSMVGIGELTRGFARVAESGKAGAFAMREFTGAAFRLTEFLGPNGAFVPIIGLVGAALAEAFIGANEHLKETRKLFDDLAVAHVRLLAELRNNKLGAKELGLNSAYADQVAQIDKTLPAPGMFSRMWAEVLGGAGVMTGSSSLLDASFNAYAGPQLQRAIALRQAGANRLLSEHIAGNEDADEQRRMADQAAKKLEAVRKLAWENAAKFAAEDLSDNENFLRILRPQWDSMWKEFSLDAEVRKSAGETLQKMAQEPFADAAAETRSTATSGVAGALAGLRDLQARGPLLGSFSTSFRRELDAMSKSTQGLGETLGTLAGQELPALAAGFEEAFAGIAAGQPVFKALEKVALQSIAHVAASMAASEFAQGLAMVARSIWDFLGPNPAAGASAVQHFAAAGLFSAIAGGATALGGGYGSGGGGGGGLSGSAVSSSTQSLAGAGTHKTTVVFPRGSIYSLLMTDPSTRDDFTQVLRDLAGDNDLQFLFE